MTQVKKITVLENLACIDEAVIQGLRALETPGESGSFLRELYTIFNTQAPVIAESLKMAYHENCLRKVKHLSHKLKGMSRNLGAARLSSVCAQMEDLASEREQLPTSAMIDELFSELKEASVELKMRLRV